MMKLTRLTDEGFETLLNDLPDNLAYYKTKSTPEWVYEKYRGRKFFSDLDISCEVPSLIAGVSNDKQMEVNCIELYTKLNITPDTAADFQFWAALSHTKEFYPFVRKSLTVHLMTDPDKIIQDRIKSNFFRVGDGQRRALLANRLSQMWWAAYLCDTGYAPIQSNLKLICMFGFTNMVGEIFRNRLYCNSAKVTQGIINGIRRFLNLDSDGFNRKRLRTAMNKMNQITGGMLIDYLEIDEISQLFFKILVTSTDEVNEHEWTEDDTQVIRVGNDEEESWQD